MKNCFDVLFQKSGVCLFCIFKIKKGFDMISTQKHYKYIVNIIGKPFNLMLKFGPLRIP